MIPNFKTFISETIWGRSMERALGNDHRIEDRLNPEERKCLDDYIEGFITLCCDGYDVMEPTYDEFMEYVEKGRDADEDDLVDVLLKYVPKNWNKGEDIESRIIKELKDAGYKGI